MNSDFYTKDNLSLDDVAKAHLAESAKWGRFLSIVGFVMIGFIVLAAMFIMTMGNAFSEAIAAASGGASGFNASVIGIMYLIIGGIYLYPTVKLFNFSKSAKAALLSNDTYMLTESLSNLKSIFKFFGIITAIVIGLYALVFVFAIAVGAGGLMSR